MQWPSGRAISELVEAHYQDLYRYAYRLSGAKAEAEDLTQETYCQAQAKLAQLRDWAAARGWLFRILRNEYLHRLRASKRQIEQTALDWDQLPCAPQASELAVEPDQLQQALGQLPEPYRAPLILFYFDGFSYRDIADQLDIPIGTVMSRLARAKAFLRERLAPHVGDERVEGKVEGGLS